MYRTIPDAKLIYVVRDPIERIVSHYVEKISRGWENRSLKEMLIEREGNSYVNCSKYYMQIEQYLEYYHRSNILVIDFDELRLDRRETLKKIFQFLEVDSSFEHKEFSILYNKSSKKRKPNRLSKYIEPVPILSRLRGRMPWLFGSPINMPVLSKSMRQELSDLMRIDVGKFRDFTGYTFTNWSF